MRASIEIMGMGKLALKNVIYIFADQLFRKTQRIWDEQQVRVWRYFGFWKQYLDCLWDSKVRGSGAQERDLLIEISKFSALSIG